MNNDKYVYSALNLLGMFHEATGVTSDKSSNKTKSFAELVARHLLSD